MVQAIDNGFKSWIVNYLKSNPDLVKDILKASTSNPKQAQEIIYNNLRIWAEKYHNQVMVFMDRAPREILQAIKENFSEELPK